MCKNNNNNNKNNEFPYEIMYINLKRKRQSISTEDKRRETKKREVNGLKKGTHHFFFVVPLTSILLILGFWPLYWLNHLNDGNSYECQLPVCMLECVFVYFAIWLPNIQCVDFVWLFRVICIKTTPKTFLSNTVLPHLWISISLYGANGFRAK